MNGDVWKCANPNCGRTCKNNKWASIKAHDEGWFFQKDGTVYCPDHIPDWVKAWREKKTDE